MKTMYGKDRAMRLASPPFEVESYLNQNIQAADWIAAIIGRMWCYRLEPEDFSDLQPYEAYFWDRVHAAASHSSVLERPKPGFKKIVTETETIVETAVAVAGQTAFAAAFERARTKTTRTT